MLIVSFELENLALDVDGDLLREVALRDGRRHVGDVAHLIGEIAGHRVDRIGKVFPRAGDPFDRRLTAELSFGTDFARDARHFGGERVELVDHRVDGAFELEDLAARLDGDLFGEIAVRDGGRHVGDVAHLVGEVAGHRVDRIREIFPRTGDALDDGLTAELSFGADLARDAHHFGGEGVELIDHRVDQPAGTEELAFERPAVDLERHALRKIAVRDGAEHASRLGHRLGEVGDQPVHRLDETLPRAAHRTERDPLRDSPFAADDEARSLQLFGETRIELDAVVKRLGDFAVDSREAEREACAEITAAKGAERSKKPALAKCIRLARTRNGRHGDSPTG